MNILIMGAGALGSVFGGLLAQAGHQVSLVGRQAHMAAIEERGLLIDGIWGQHQVHDLATYTTAEAVPQASYDLILITTKAHDTERAVREVAGLMGQATLAVSLQNGLGNLEAIAAVVGRERTVGGRVIFGVELLEPGQVRVTVYADKVLLGGIEGGPPGERIENIAATFSAAGIPTAVTSEIVGYIWGKVLYNACLNGLSAILEVPYGELARHQETRELMDAIIEESYAVARARGVRLLQPTPEEYQRLFYEELLPPTAAHRSSMLQDIERGKRTEIDALNGAIVRLGEEAGVSTPVNKLVTALVKVKERVKK